MVIWLYFLMLFYFSHYFFVCVSLFFIFMGFHGMYPLSFLFPFIFLLIVPFLLLSFSFYLSSFLLYIIVPFLFFFLFPFLINMFL